MTEDEVYDIIRGYEESERDFYERNIELENENAKLRKLLCQVVEYVHEEHLPHEDISFWSDRDNGVFRRMYKLGIEVDE